MTFSDNPDLFSGSMAKKAFFVFIYINSFEAEPNCFKSKTRRIKARLVKAGGIILLLSQVVGTKWPRWRSNFFRGRRIHQQRMHVHFGRNIRYKFGFFSNVQVDSPLTVSATLLLRCPP